MNFPLRFQVTSYFRPLKFTKYYVKTNKKIHSTVEIKRDMACNKLSIPNTFNRPT